MDEKTAIAIEPILRTFQKVQPYLTTLSPATYNYYKDANMPPAQAIMKAVAKSWHDILGYLGMSTPLDRDTLSRLSCSLHLLEKRIVETFGLAWQERSFAMTGKKKLRPDAFDVERSYIQNNRLFILDVKLSLCSAPIAIYKYLPIFEKSPIANQMSFFADWLSEAALNDELGLESHADGQLELFGKHNILYIAYLIGKPQKPIQPGTEISLGRVAVEKKKKLPHNMEVRFIEFRELPALYCQLGGVSYDEPLVAPIVALAERIKDVVVTMPKDAGEVSRAIYQEVKELGRMEKSGRQNYY